MRLNGGARMRAKLKELLKHARDVSLDALAIGFVIVLGLGSTVLAFLILLAPNLLAGAVAGAGDRIALATFFIEFAAVAAIGLAGYEFWRAHQGPRLRIQLTAEERSDPRHVIYLGDATSHPSAMFRFDMLLENAGPVAGRWMKVTVTATMLGGMQTARVLRLRPLWQSSAGQWEQITDLGCAFLGNDSFVSYPRPRDVHRRYLPIHSWADLIGRFELTCETRHETIAWDETGGLAQVNTTVWTDRSRRFDQEFVLLSGQYPDAEAPAP